MNEKEAAEWRRRFWLACFDEHPEEALRQYFLKRLAGQTNLPLGWLNPNINLFEQASGKIARRLRTHGCRVMM